MEKIQEKNENLTIKTGKDSLLIKELTNQVGEQQDLIESYKNSLKIKASSFGENVNADLLLLNGSLRNLNSKIKNDCEQLASKEAILQLQVREFRKRGDDLEVEVSQNKKQVSQLTERLSQSTNNLKVLEAEKDILEEKNEVLGCEVSQLLQKQQNNGLNAEKIEVEMDKLVKQKNSLLKIEEHNKNSENKLKEQYNVALKRIQNLEQVVVRERDKRKELELEVMELKEVRRINDQLTAKSNYLEHELRARKRSTSTSKSFRKRQHSVAVNPSNQGHKRNGSTASLVQRISPTNRMISSDKLYQQQQQQQYQQQQYQEVEYDNTIELQRLAQRTQYSQDCSFKKRMRQTKKIEKETHNIVKSYLSDPQMLKYNTRIISRMVGEISSSDRRRNRAGKNRRNPNRNPIQTR